MKKIKLKLQNRILRWALAFAGILGLSGAAFAESPSLRELLAEKLSDKLVSKLEASLGLEEEALGLANIDVSATGLTNLRVGGKRCYGSSSSTDIYRCSQKDVEEWPGGTTTLAIQNNRSTSSTLSRVVFDMSGARGEVASSSFLLSCGTSTARYVAYNSAAPPSAIFRDVLIATSSQVVLDSLLATSTFPNPDIGSRFTVIVPPSAYLVCIAQGLGIPGSRLCDQNGVQCEAPTSSNRGWQAVLSADWEWTEGGGQGY